MLGFIEETIKTCLRSRVIYKMMKLDNVTSKLIDEDFRFFNSFISEKTIQPKRAGSNSFDSESKEDLLLMRR